MATKEGGSLFGKVGSLEPGYVFDALVIRDFSDPFRRITPAETVERFCYTGTAADITARFMNGKQL
jgi:guanine deaminase